MPVSLHNNNLQNIIGNLVEVVTNIVVHIVVDIVVVMCRGAIQKTALLLPTKFQNPTNIEFGLGLKLNLVFDNKPTIKVINSFS